MTDNQTGSYEPAANSETLQKTLRKLSLNRFYNDLGIDKNIEIEESQIRQAAWIASLVANSPEDEHRQLALSFAVLAYQRASSSEVESLFRNYLYVILSRLGNVPVAEQYVSDLEGLTAVANLVDDQERTGDRDQVSATLQHEVGFTSDYYDAGDSILTEFQFQVWSALQERQFVAFSGPTSSGKSHLLQEYIDQRIQESESFVGVYIVPSRALIAEVSVDFSNRLVDDVVIQTGVTASDMEHDQLLYVLTPERCLKLFESISDLNIDVVFFDEIQNLEDNTRGALFEYVIDTLIAHYPESQFIAAGPFIENVSDPLEESVKYLDVNAEGTDFNQSVEGIETDYSPVYRQKSEFTFRRRSKTIDVRTNDQAGLSEEIEIERPTDITFSTARGNRTKTIEKFVENYHQDEPLLIYASSPTRAEKIAARLAEGRRDSNEEERFKPFTQFLRSEVDKEYDLIDVLQGGVAYHHGSVPNFARSEIERLYNEKKINIIVSTSTLLEGVNLPASKILVVDHKKGRKQELSPFELQNLVGRVGRIGKRLHGQVFYIDHEDDTWAREHIESETKKIIEPVTENVIQEHTEKLAELLANSLEDTNRGKHRSTAILLKSRYLLDKETTERFISSKLRDTGKFEMLTSNLEQFQSRISMPKHLIRKNPSVDPDLQNILYKQVSKNPDNWVMNESNLYIGLVSLISQLDDVFYFISKWERDEGKTETRGDSSQSIAGLATHWLKGRSYQEMVSRRQSDESTSKTLKKINRDNRYVLSKYFKILGDILGELSDPTITAEEKEFTISLHQYLERGTYDDAILLLMNMGVSRAVALQIDPPSNITDRQGMTDYLLDNREIFSDFSTRHLESHGLLE